MSYRIRKGKGSNVWWIENCAFTILGFGFFCIPHGRRVLTKGGSRIARFEYETYNEAYETIKDVIKENKEYKKSKEFKSAWIKNERD